MRNRNFYGVIMAGGIGSRFWPISTDENPKQFLDILNTGETLLQQTYRRLKNVILEENILIVSNVKYKEKIMNQLPDLSEDNILLEPEKKNTAPCIAYASFKIKAKNKGASIVVTPSDHYIQDEEKFSKNIIECLEASQKNKNVLITLGIKPTRPDTGYGYINLENNFLDNTLIQKVKKFTEKPNLELAKKFIDNGNYLWNAGIFIWSVNAIINSFKNYLPEMYNIFDDGKDFFYTENESYFIKNNFSKCKEESIDFGIMEKSKEVYVLASDFGWSDLGTWKSIYEIMPKNEKNNVLDSKNTYMYNSKDNIVKNLQNKKVVIKGLDNFIVVDTNKALLILPKDQEQSIKEILEDIKN